MSQPTSSAPRLLMRAREAAFMLNISARKLWGLTAGGQIPVIRIGRSVRYAEADLRAWIDRQRGGKS